MIARLAGPAVAAHDLIRCPIAITGMEFGADRDFENPVADSASVYVCSEPERLPISRCSAAVVLVTTILSSSTAIIVAWMATPLTCAVAGNARTGYEFLAECGRHERITEAVAD